MMQLKIFFLPFAEPRKKLTYNFGDFVYFSHQEANRKVNRTSAEPPFFYYLLMIRIRKGRREGVGVFFIVSKEYKNKNKKLTFYLPFPVRYSKWPSAYVKIVKLEGKKLVVAVTADCNL